MTTEFTTGVSKGSSFLGLCRPCKDPASGDPDSLIDSPACSSKFVLIIMGLIGVIGVFLGVLAVVVLGYTQPGTILGITFFSIGILCLSIVITSWSKKRLVTKINERLQTSKVSRDELSEKYNSVLENSNQIQGTLIGENRQALENIQTSLKSIEQSNQKILKRLKDQPES